MASYWQDNFPLIKDVFDGRTTKLTDNMDACDKSVTEVFADKIYPLREFRTIKENFLTIAKNIEDRELKDWIIKTSEQIQYGMDQKTSEGLQQKIDALIGRLDSILPKVRQAKDDVESLWKAYTFTDELTPQMEWLNDKSEQINKPLKSDSAEETEVLVERVENVISQLEKKKKSFLGTLQQAGRLISNPKIPKFLEREVKNARKVWDDTNKLALDHLAKLQFNKESWEKFEEQKNSLTAAIDLGEQEKSEIQRIYDVEKAIEDYKNRLKSAADVRKNIEEAYKVFNATKTSVQELCSEEVKEVIDGEVNTILEQAVVNDQIDDTLKAIDEFHGSLKEYLAVLKKLETWPAKGQGKMMELLHPDKRLTDQEKVVMTMELMDDVAQELEKHQSHSQLWTDRVGPSKTSPESERIVLRMSAVHRKLLALQKDVDKEAEQYGDDVKNLADVMKCNKKFDPWVLKNEERIRHPLEMGSSLEASKENLEAIIGWKTESVEMRAVLDKGNAAAKLMSSHENADEVYFAFVKRWEVVHAKILEVIPLTKSFIKLWEEQAVMAEKIQDGITDPHTTMELPQLEKLFMDIKTLMFEKQKIMMKINPPSKDA